MSEATLHSPAPGSDLGTGARSRRMMQSLTVSSVGPNLPQASRWIPIPDVPVRPILSYGSFLGRRRLDIDCVLDHGVARVDVTAGRVAIALSLGLMNLGRNAQILVPAFHCASMIEPLEWVKAEPVFYRIGADLSIDVDHLCSRLTDRSAAVIVPHYFGFPQDVVRLRQICDSRGLFLVEDCAHSLFGSVRGTPLGSIGDYAIASLTKFYPVREGGVLISNRHLEPPLRLRSQSAATNLYETFATVQEATYHRRLWPLGPLVGAVEMARRLTRGSPPAGSRRRISPAQQRSGTRGEMDRDWLDVKISAASLLVSKLASRERLVRRRREHYATLLEATRDLPGCRPLLPDLMDGVVPYMFPLWVERLDEIFPKLEDRAVPMQRFGQFLWEGMDQSICGVSTGLSKHLVQFPCHQELTDSEMDWLISTIRDTVLSC